MKLLLLTLLLLLISFPSFSQKARVLLAYNAFNSDKDSLQIGDTLSYNSENLNGKENELIFLKENAYLALMNENGSILEWKNKETGNYKIEFEQSDTTFNGARKYIIKDLCYHRSTKSSRIYLGMREWGGTWCPPYNAIGITGQGRSNYVKDSLKIFIEFSDYHIRNSEEVKQNSLKIELRSLKNDSIATYMLDSNFFVLDWNKLPNYERIYKRNKKRKYKKTKITSEYDHIVYKFYAKTNKRRKISSISYILSKPELFSYQEKYFQSKEKTGIGAFIQFLCACENYNLNIYACQLYQESLDKLPNEIHSIIPSLEDFLENKRIMFVNPN